MTEDPVLCTARQFRDMVDARDELTSVEGALEPYVAGRLNRDQPLHERVVLVLAEARNEGYRVGYQHAREKAEQDLERVTEGTA